MHQPIAAMRLVSTCGWAASVFSPALARAQLRGIRNISGSRLPLTQTRDLETILQMAARF
jgi:hypothetical protein